MLRCATQSIFNAVAVVSDAMMNLPDDARSAHALPVSDYVVVFARTPGRYLVLDPSFTIVAANDAYCAATMTARDAIVGRHLFEVFPDNPGDSAADGVQNLRASLLAVLKSRAPDRMDVQKYDIKHDGIGPFETRYWSPCNVPVLGEDGYVKWIIHSIEDVTERELSRRERLRPV